MKRIALLLFGIAAFAACAEANEAGPASESPDGGLLPPAPDADVITDAGSEADVEVDAAPRECSKQGYCPTALPSGTHSLRGVWGDANGVVWAIAEEGTILRYDGAAWKVHDATIKEPLRAIWGSGPLDLWIGTENGNLYHSSGATSDTLTFAAVTIPGPVTPITGVSGTSATDVWAVGGVDGFPPTGRALHFDGTDWTQESFGKQALAFHRVSAHPTAGVFLVGRRTNPTYFDFELFALHRAAGEATFAELTLPTDPTLPGNPVGRLERLFDASLSADGSTLWILSRTHTGTYAYVSGPPSTLAFHAKGANQDPIQHFIGSLSANDTWIGGDFGRLAHWTGTSWNQALVTTTKFPVIDPFWAMGGHGSDLWFVGDGLALHRIPAKAQP